MFRASFRLPKRALLATSVAATDVVLHDAPREKLSIYPTPTPDILLVETPSVLEKHIGVARRRVTEAYRDTHSQVQGVISRWIGVEHAIENRVKSIVSPNESITPGILYVGVATLSGSIIARNRILATRLLLPPTFLLISANYFLPETTANLSSYLGSLEEKYFPTMAQKHDVANAHTRMTWERIKDATQNGREWVTHGAVSAVERVQVATGLKLKETLGWAQAETQLAKRNFSVVEKVVEEQVHDKVVALEEKTEKKIEQVKRLV
ncbi:MICOS subunit MIC26 [Hypsizygus marmoreus]|uniref:MICOS complex subunit n=1 Tax=Hypsizygus marmoreus TaxID=39966 RepID=A0A369J8E8_HYPMA|nr:MICOS subunit MIC26 [Hypsizygus marmoreus]